MDLSHDPFIAQGRYLGRHLSSLSWVVSQILGVGVISRLPLSRFFPSVFVAKREYFHCTLLLCIYCRAFVEYRHPYCLLSTGHGQVYVEKAPGFMVMP